jgi:uncharacterized radical SAM superfamily Fe-S cluster-containing enzyme
MPDRRLLGLTESTCPTCRKLVPAKVLGINGDVWFEKFCPEHGSDLVFVRADVEDYLRTLRVVKPASVPLTFAGDPAKPCPEGCGFCERHEQHLCLPIVEITQECDLACPICLVDAGQGTRMTRAAFASVLDGLLVREPQIDVLNLSGGEPLTHPDILDLLDEALSRKEIVRVSLSTHGLRLLQNRPLARALKERDVVVSLQFDGFDDAASQFLRGRPMAQDKRAVLELLGELDITTSLTFTAARGVNENGLEEALSLLFSRDHIVSLMVQPLCYTGRAGRLPRPEKRLSIPEILDLMQATGRVRHDDFSPLPCCHPVCFSLAFFLGEGLSLGRLFDADTCLNAVANRAIFGLDEDSHDRLKALVYDLWSGPAANVPESQKVLKTVQKLLRRINDRCACAFDPRAAFAAGERAVKSIFVHAFMDADTFDLARARRCCNGYPQEDGTVIPACVRNVVRNQFTDTV